MLVIADKWLLIGPNRHGSLYCRDVLQAAFDARPSSGDKPHHTPLCRIPANVRAGKKVIGIVRCPLRWYVSKWAIFAQNARPEKWRSFGDYFWDHWQNPHGPIGKATEDFPLPVAEIGGWSYQHVAYHCLDAERALGQMSRDELAAALPTLRSVDYMLCTETLSADLVRLFGDGVRRHLGKPQNGTRTGDVMSLYSKEQLQAVRKCDGWLADYYPHLDYHKFMEARAVKGKLT